MKQVEKSTYYSFKGILSSNDACYGNDDTVFYWYINGKQLGNFDAKCCIGASYYSPVRTRFQSAGTYEVTAKAVCSGVNVVTTIGSKTIIIKEECSDECSWGSNECVGSYVCYGEKCLS